MNRMSCVFVTLGTVFVCAAALPETSSTRESDTALGILARTKAATATYSLYSWNWITPPGIPPTEEWSAEFNEGHLHRVETPRDRLVANCVEKSGTAYHVASAETFSGPGVAGAACGIDTNTPIISIRYIGRVVDRLGPADRVEVTDAQRIRTYDVTSDGILIRTIYALNTPEKPIVLDVETAALVRKLPRQNIFDPSSLAQSVVPDAYKKAPPFLP